MLQYKLRTSKIIKQRAIYAAVNYDAPNDPELTRSEQDLLRFLCLMSGKNGYCWPRIDYLCVGLDLDPRTNHRNMVRRLAKLETLGYITRDARFDHRTTGRQMSNKITINYVSSHSTYSQDAEHKFTIPINIKIYNNPLKEKLKQKENSPMVPWTYPKVKLVYGWKERLFGKGCDFTVMRSNSLVRGLARLICQQNTGKWKYLLAENENSKLHKLTGEKAMTIATDDDLDDLFTRPTHKIPPTVKFSTISVDKPVDKTMEVATRADNIGGVSWKNICAQMNRLNDQFQHWQIRMYMSGLNGHTLEIFTELPYFRDTCQQRFGEDLLKACKKLEYPVKFVKIKLRNE